MYLLSSFQAKRFLLKRPSFEVSLDLGLTQQKIKFLQDKFCLPDNQTITTDHIKKILKKNDCIFLIENDDIHKVNLFSEKTNKYYKLVPTGPNTPPTLEISGIRMHVTKSMSPQEDTEKKISYVSPIMGKVLDACTGLGYTAISASTTSDEVWTYEIDEACIEMQKMNPWSKILFNNPKIKRHHGDIFEEIISIKDKQFDRIIHDPPRLSMATLLYSQGFYDQLFRVMKKEGKLYHYTGNPGSKNRGMDLQKNVMDRLEISGFKDLKRVFNGVIGRK